MSQANPRGGPVHQDYIVRQRYSNALPPPPGLPKFLNMRTSGLEHYTSPLYASRLARNQPLNIEADAFLGMPIDLVGMPGVFDGDDSALLAPTKPGPMHPTDKNLLRPLKSIGQPKVDTGISFLRRTQYTAEDRSKLLESNRHAVYTKRRKVDETKENKVTILRNVIKGFDIANPEDAYTGPDTDHEIRGAQPSKAEQDAWTNPKHPSKPNLKPLDIYPIIPDFEAAAPPPDGFMVARFNGAPFSKDEGYDPRMEVAILRAMDPSDEMVAEYEAKVAAHDADPENNPAPGLLKFDYEFFLPEDRTTTSAIKRKRDIDEGDEDVPYSHTAADEPDKGYYQYQNTKVYETGVQISRLAFPYEEVALTLHDGDERKGIKKAARYYPLGSKQQLKQKRTVLAKTGLVADGMDESDRVDVVQLRFGPADEATQQAKDDWKRKFETVAIEAS